MQVEASYNTPLYLNFHTWVILACSVHVCSARKYVISDTTRRRQVTPWTGMVSKTEHRAPLQVFMYMDPGQQGEQDPPSFLALPRGGSIALVTINSRSNTGSSGEWKERDGGGAGGQGDAARAPRRARVVGTGQREREERVRLGINDPQSVLMEEYSSALLSL